MKTPLASPSPQRNSSVVERVTVVSATLEALRNKILRGELPDGTQLRQDVLAEEYGVSRIPVREALRQLEAEGLVTFYPHRGAVVAGLSPEEIAELFEMRALLEPDLLRRAMPRLTPEDLDKARRILNEYEASLRGGQMAGWGELNWLFHSTLYAPASRPQSMSVIQQLNRRSSRYIQMQLLFTHGERRAETEHRRILAACERRAVKRGCELLASHILNAGESLVRFLAGQREAQETTVRT